MHTNPATASGPSAAEEYGTWPLDKLATFIEESFHNYIRQATPAIRKQLHALCETYGAQYPLLTEAEQLFIHATDELEKHLLHEEYGLFPAIETLYGKAETPGVTPRITSDLITRLMREHQAESALFRRITELTSNYTAPEGTCERFRDAFAQLQEFDRKLRRHIQLEDDALFPTAVEMTDRLARERQE